jgi:hypothetical protein
VTGDDGTEIYSIAGEQRSDEDGAVTLDNWDNGLGGDGWLKGWFDFNADGVFDTFVNQAATAGVNVIAMDVLAGAFLPDGSLASGTVGIYARFCLFDTAADSRIDDTGLAANGEVEDYFQSFSSTAVTQRTASALNDESATKFALLASILIVMVRTVRRREQN